jgi:hypothetical protein
MALSFPNRSRSFDPARKAVRFIGHDGMFEVPFLIKADAFAKSGSSEMNEADCLAAFDAARSRILDVAQKAYARGRSTTLTAADF